MKQSRALRLLLSIFATLGLTALLILILGVSPIDAFYAVLKGSLGSSFGVGQTLAIGSLLILTGLGAALPFTARLWNIGGEGQMYAGAMAAAAIGIVLPETWPSFVLVSLPLVASAAAGAFWGLIPAFLKVKFRASEIVSSLMLNFVAIIASTYVINELWPHGFAQQTKSVSSGARFPTIWTGGQVDLGIIIALAMAASAWVLVRRSSLGFSIRAVGANEQASRLAGIYTSTVTFVVFGFGGAFAGLAGACAVLGIYGALVHGFSASYGYIGIAVALIARLNPFAIIPAGLVFAILSVGSNSLMATVGLSPATGPIIVSVFVISAMVFGVIRFQYSGGSDAH